MTSFAQFAQDAFRLGLQGRDVDLVIRTVAPNVRDADPFIAIPLTGVDQLRAMLPDAADRYLYIERDRFYFSALYEPEERCPWPRVYAFKTGEDLFTAASVARRLNADGYDLRPVSPDGMRAMLSTDVHATRVAEYRGRLRSRFDSSNDHPELPYGPDHFHYDLPADNSKVRSSFLTGVPELDVLALREFLAQIES